MGEETERMEAVKKEDLQLAENIEIEDSDNEEVNEFAKKRLLLEKTKIVKQTWSISEIYQKIRSKKLILNPIYQREEIWDKMKKTAFIESLYMGIMVPPIYVVEIPSDDVLSDNEYEVVDGKQRLTAIMDYINSDLKLDTKSLEYYADMYGFKTFTEIKELDSEKTNEMLSSVLDIYVITANSPEFTKYDIFARLNKGSEKLKVNEIRRAIYRSETSNIISNYISEILKYDTIDKTNEKFIEYKKLFTNNDIKRFEDYGRFYRSVAFYIRSDVELGSVSGYNSRPREMINTVLQELQKKELLSSEEILIILESTIELLQYFGDSDGAQYIVDGCIPFVVNNKELLKSKLQEIKNDQIVLGTLLKSPATTSNVDERFSRIIDILGV